jgi:hypothetical protein
MLSPGTESAKLPVETENVLYKLDINSIFRSQSSKDGCLRCGWDSIFEVEGLLLPFVRCTIVHLVITRQTGQHTVKWQDHTQAYPKS